MVIDNDISSHKNSNKNNPLNFNRELTEDIIEVEIPNIPSNNNPPNIINNNNNNIRTSSRLRGVEPENQGLINNKGLMVLSDKNDDIKDNDHFYALASQAFSSIKEELKEEENNLEEKIIINFKDNNPSNIIEPNTYQEAIKSPYKEYWEKAMKKELNSLKSNNTWNLVKLPSNYKPLNTRWVYKLKKFDNFYEFKARFVAKGYEQLYGLDYIETFASVIKHSSWRILFALALIYNYYIYKIDIILVFI